MIQPQIALQLYTVRERTARDMVATLKELTGIGYQAVELAGYGGLAVPDLRAVLDHVGLRAMGAHVPYDGFATQPGRVLEDLQQLGCEFAVLPSLPPQLRTGSGVRSLPATFNGWGEQCRAAGLRFAYHNHDVEFTPVRDGDGGCLFDLLLAETDPAFIGFELDVYWTRFAGADPIALLQRHSGRFPLIHVKDMADDSARSDAPVGTGIIDWRAVLDAAAGCSWAIIEQDHPADPLADVTVSLRNLERMMIEGARSRSLASSHKRETTRAGMKGAEGS